MEKPKKKRKNKRVMTIPLAHPYCIIAPGFPWAVRCDKMEGPPLPPESYPTLEETVDRLPILFLEVAKRCFPAMMPLPAGSLRVAIVTFDEALSGNFDYDDHTQAGLNKDQIIAEFQNANGSLPLVGLIYFWETLWDQISCFVQGTQEIQQYLQSPDGQELSQVAQSLGAVLQTGNGIVVQ